MNTLGSSMEYLLQIAAQGQPLEFASPLEQRLCDALVDLGIPPVRQHPVWPYTLDFYYPDEKLCVEVDGAAYHDSDRDRRRDRTLRLDHGISTRRFTGKEVYRDAAWCARQVRWRLGELRGERWSVTRQAIYHC